MTVVYEILKESWYLYLDVAIYMLFGFFVAGLLYVFFKAEKIKQFFGTGKIKPVILSTLFGIPIYVYATTSTPIAAALILKGLNPGAALVFLLAGPATNAATINLVKNTFNTRALATYLSMISISSLLISFLVDAIYDLMNIQASAVVGQAAEIFPENVQLVSAAILTGLIVFNLIANYRQQGAHVHSH